MRNKDKVKESAAAGSVGASSIAVRVDSDDKNMPSMKKRSGSFLDFMQKHNSKVVNRLNMKPVKNPFNIKLKEDVSLDQMYSKLGGIQNQSRMQDDNTQTYGVEDDEGNLMKITVRGDQQEEFEEALARELAEVEEYKMTGRGGGGRNVSMAEVLYNLKQNFDVVNVEFPEIPKDKVYNADKVSDPDELDTELPDPEANMGNAEQSDEELGDVDFGGEEGDALGGEMGAEGEEGEMPGEEGEEDLGTEFGAEEESEESMLKTIVKMLSAEAEARKAQYDAEAEKSRAMQAKYSMKAAQEEMENQEDLVQMEKEMEEQKNKEKEAKKLADLARFKMRGDVKEGYNKVGLGEFITQMFEMDEESGEDEPDPNDPVERRLRQQTANAKKRLQQHRDRKFQQREIRDKQEQDDTHPNQQPKRVAAP